MAVHNLCQDIQTTTLQQELSVQERDASIRKETGDGVEMCTGRSECNERNIL